MIHPFHLDQKSITVLQGIYQVEIRDHERFDVFVEMKYRGPDRAGIESLFSLHKLLPLFISDSAIQTYKRSNVLIVSEIQKRRPCTETMTDEPDPVIINAETVNNLFLHEGYVVRLLHDVVKQILVTIHRARNPCLRRTRRYNVAVTCQEFAEDRLVVCRMEVPLGDNQERKDSISHGEVCETTKQAVHRHNVAMDIAVPRTRVG